jgi:integrase
MARSLGRVKKPLILTFARVAEAYLGERIVSDVYAGNVRRVAVRCGEVTVDRVNGYLRQRSQEVASVTVRSERTILLSLYKWAFETGMIDDAPRGVMRVKARKAPTKAWTVPQLQQLVKATKAYEGRKTRTGADLGVFLRCWVLVAYETGSRFGDCMAFSADHLEDDTLSWTQSKTGDPMVRPLTPACLDAIDQMLAASPDGRILGWACGRRMAMRHMRKLLDSQGLGGSSKWLRRSGATHCEMERAGAGRLHLGHRSPALFEQAYCDWGQLRKNTPKTPAIL